MFTPIKPEIVKMIKDDGEIKFFVLEGWELLAVHGSFTTIPHKVTYVRRFTYNNHYHILDCRMSLEKHSLIIEDLRLVERDINLPALGTSLRISKPLEYMFLEMTMEAAEDMGHLSRKENLIVTSKLSTFSEVASEAGFRIRKPPLASYFKAAKTLKLKKVRNT